MAKETNWLLIILGVLAVAYFFNIGGLKDKISGTPSAQVSTTTTPYISTGATTFNFIGSDAMEAGTKVLVTTYVSTNGGAYSSSVTSGSPGETISILLDNTSYHAVYLPNLKVETAPTQTFNVPMYKNASGMTSLMTIYNTNGDKFSTSVNQTTTSGGAYNWKIRMDGVDKMSTNPMRCILEASNGTQVKTLTLSGFGAKFVGKEKPSSYTLATASSEIWVYDVDALTGAVSPEGTIGVQAESGYNLEGLAAFVRIDCFSKENFIDTDTGKVTEMGIESMQGTLKSIAHYKSNANFSDSG